MTKWSSILPDNALQCARTLMKRAAEERRQGKTIYPPQNAIFRALQLTLPEEVKVVIVGQDPYHEPGQANGLAFSVAPDVPLPPSLQNIYRELEADLGVSAPSNGDLTGWARQGVLLLNTVLTVERGRANSHKNWGWQTLVLEVYRVCASLPQPVVFLLWGGQARAFTAELSLTGRPNKAVLCSSHPSPLGATKGSASVPAFLGSRPFSRTNELLVSMGAEPVNWSMQESAQRQ